MKKTGEGTSAIPGTDTAGPVDGLVRRFETFETVAPPDFRDRMIRYWMDLEDFDSEAEALKAYGGEEFDWLCEEATKGTESYTPDLGYSDPSLNGTLCFMDRDNNFVIPVSVLLA